jgi:16S rRNA processing protein RimM
VSSSTSSIEVADPAGVVVGVVGKPHGLDGSFHVLQPRPGALALGAALTVSGRTAEVTRLAGTDDRPIVRLDLAGDREAAAALRGADLVMARDAVGPLEEDEFWAEELEGCAVVDGDRPVGVVRRLLGLPSCDVLEVEREGGGDLLVPLVRDAVRAIDVEARTIDVDLAFLGE